VSVRRRLVAWIALVAVLATGAVVARAAIDRPDPTPPPRPLDRAVTAALRKPAPPGVVARIRVTNRLFPAGSVRGPLAALLGDGARGRLWADGEGRFRIRLGTGIGPVELGVAAGRLRVASRLPAAFLDGVVGRDPFGLASRRRATLPAVRRALRPARRYFELSSARPTSTAGRPSYTVRIAPRDDGGLLGAAEVAWDARSGLPLRAALYTRDQGAPVFEVALDRIRLRPVPASALVVRRPPGARRIGPGPRRSPGGERAPRPRPTDAAPARIAGMPRRFAQRLPGSGLVAVYGSGLGTILAFQGRAEGPLAELARPGLGLPEVNIGGATGTELASTLGTAVGVRSARTLTLVAGLVPPLAAENAARDLR